MMIKKISFLLILVLVGNNAYSLHPSWIVEDEPRPLSSFSCSVLRRYYYIQRCTSLMRIVTFLYYHTPSKVHQLFYDLTVQSHQESPVYSAISRVYEEKKIDAFSDLWQAFTGYRYLSDACIDNHMFTVLNYLVSQEIKSDSTPSLEAIIFRFYFLKKTEHLFRHMLEAPNLLIGGYIASAHIAMFQHAEIRECLRSLATEKTVQPFLTLYKKICAYDYIEDGSFYKEFLMLTLLVIQLIHRDSCQDNKQPMSFSCETAYREHTISSLIYHDLGMSTDYFIQSVLRRMYCINRLSCSYECDNNPPAYRSIASVRPLAMMWLDFVRYMHLDSQLLVDPIIKELFLIMNESRMIEVDTIMRPPVLLPRPLVSYELHDVKPFVSADDVVRRFYYVNRLKRAVSLVKSCESYVNFDFSACECITHPVIRDCISSLAQSNNTQPFNLLACKFDAYYYIADEQFEFDYLVLVYYLCHHLLVQQKEKQNGMIKVSCVTTHELLNAIDVCQTLFESYQSA